MPRERQTLFFSATLDGAVGRLARALHERRPPPRAQPAGAKAGQSSTASSRRARGQARPLVGELRPRPRPHARLRAHQARRRPARQAPAPRGVDAAAMHGDKSQGQREKALAALRGRPRDTLVATDVAARGIDVDDITHVINFDAPDGPDDYVHRVGRTGRAGRTRHRHHVRARRPGARGRGQFAGGLGLRRRARPPPGSPPPRPSAAARAPSTATAAAAREGRRRRP